MVLLNPNKGKDEVSQGPTSFVDMSAHVCFECFSVSQGAKALEKEIDVPRKFVLQVFQLNGPCYDPKSLSSLYTLKCL